MTETKNEVKISAHFWLRRLHSLSGVVPIGAFLVEHMIANAFIVKGPEAYNGIIAALSGMPYVIFLEVFGIYLPILFHAFYGFYVTFTGRSNLRWYPYGPNWLYMLQRWTGAITFVYVMYHAYHTRGVNLLYGVEVSYERMAELMSDPRIFWFYFIGLTAVMFHFANGLWGFLISWGIVIGPKARKVSGIVCASIGVTLFAIGINSILHLAR